MLKLYLFGTPQATFVDTPLTQLNRSAICLRLLAFLAMHQGRAHTREYLTALFWPELPAKRANRTLNNVIWRLRQGLGAGADRFVGEAGSVQFQLLAEDWLDAVEFEQHVAEFRGAFEADLWDEQVTQFEAISTLYRAEFLAGFRDEWIAPLRESRQEAYVAILQHFAASCKRHDDLARLQTVQQLLLAAGAREDPAPDRSTVLLSLQETPNKVYIRRELEILCKRDELLDLMADRQEQQANLLLAQALAEQLGDPVAELDILARQAWVATQRGEYATSLALGQEGLRIAITADLSLARAAFHRQIGIASEELGDFHAALHHYSKALSYDEANHHQQFLPADLNNVATMQLTQGDYCQGIVLLKRAQSLCMATPQPAVHCKVLGNLGYGWMKLGQLSTAREFLLQAERCAEEVGDQSARWWVAIIQSKVAYLRDNCDAALGQLQQLYEWMEAGQGIGLLAYLADTFAWLYCDQKDGEKAYGWAVRACDYATEHHQWRYRLRGFLRLAQAEWQRRNYQSASMTISNAIVLYKGKGQQLEEAAELFRTHAQCARSIGNHAVAIQAEARAERALGHQLAMILEPALRKRFLQSVDISNSRGNDSG